jgi:hypothetical protein
MTIPAHRFAGTTPQTAIANYGTEAVDPKDLLSPAERGARALAEAGQAPLASPLEIVKAKPGKSEA